MVKNGSSHGQPQALCGACGSSVTLNYATAYYGLECEPAIFETALCALAEGNSIRATCRILQIGKDTVCDWLDRAALHCRSVALYFWTGITSRYHTQFRWHSKQNFIGKNPKIALYHRLD